MMKQIILTLITVFTIAFGMATAHATGLSGSDPNDNNGRSGTDGSGTSALGASTESNCAFCNTPSSLTLSSGDRRAQPGAPSKSDQTNTNRGGTGN